MNEEDNLVSMGSKSTFFTKKKEHTQQKNRGILHINKREKGKKMWTNEWKAKNSFEGEQRHKSTGKISTLQC